MTRCSVFDKILLAIFVQIAVTQAFHKMDGKLVESTELHSDLDEVKVFDCFEYDGRDQLVDLKLNAMSPFVDYFIIVEKQNFATNATSPFRFNISNFLTFSTQILYTPIRNLPHRKATLQESEEKLNQLMIQRAINKMLTVLYQPKDIIILSQNGQIIKESVIDIFIEQNMSYACVELYLRSQFLNRISLHNQTIHSGVQNLWSESTRIITQSFYQKQFANDSYAARRWNQCSKESSPQKGKPHIFQRAGWLYLKDEKQDKIHKKIKETFSDIYFADWTLDKDLGPQFLIKDLEENRERSRYAPFITYLKEKALPIIFNHTDDSQSRAITYKQDRKVIVCNPFNGEHHLILLKAMVMSKFVDFFIVTQGFYSHTGIQKKLQFNHSLYGAYAHKMIYMPLRNFPAPYKTSNQTQKWNNEHYMRDAINQMLDVLAIDIDVIISGDVDEIIHYQAFKRYYPQQDPFAVVEVRMSLFYLNRMSHTSRKGIVQHFNYHYSGIRITTGSYIRNHFGGRLSTLRSSGCNLDVLSRPNSILNCQAKLIRNAGWHFSYVLDDFSLMKKFRSYADNGNPNIQIVNYTSERNGGVSPNAYNIDGDFLNSSLPLELVQDLITHGNNSVFAKYLTPMYMESLPKPPAVPIPPLKPEVEVKVVQDRTDVTQILESQAQQNKSSQSIFKENVYFLLISHSIAGLIGALLILLVLRFKKTTHQGIKHKQVKFSTSEVDYQSERQRIALND